MDDKRVRFEAHALPHLDAAYNLARWLTRSPADADDVVQDAMMRAFRAFDDVRGGEVKPWLLAIVRNCFLTAARRAKDRKIIPLIDERRDGEEAPYHDEAPDPEAAAVHADQSRKLNGLIAGLPQEFREVVVLREMEDLSYREIAEIVGVPLGTVMSRLARGRALLKEKWEHNVEGGRHAVR
jgi:RNA polymerase sigma-70 factor (ECF subfamily)